MGELRSLLRSVADRLGDDFAVCGGVVAAVADMPLHPDEARFAAAVAARRKAEFICGRVYAHRALRRLGRDTPFIGRDEAGAPLWPAGIAGSISHSRCYCVAVAVKADIRRSVGLDITQIRRVRPRLWDKLFTRAERKSIEAAPAAQRQRRAGVMFSAKEAAYKCLFPVHGAFIGLREAQVVIKSGHEFIVKIAKPGHPPRLAGVYAEGETHALAVAYTAGAAAK